METNELFDLAELLDDNIAHIERNVTKLEAQLYAEKCKLSALKEYREHIQTGIEANISAMENETGE
jgi:hypothetical protein